MEVSEALAQRDPNLVLSSAFKLRITQRDLSTLLEGGWLNDEVLVCLTKMDLGSNPALSTEDKIELEKFLLH